MARFQGDLPARTYRFGLAILALVDDLPTGPKGWAVARQVLRSGTSIGANTHEADVALTDREFAQFCNIARREAAETLFWLRLAKDAGLLTSQRTDACIVEVNELTKILASIVRKTQQHVSKGS